MMKVGIKGGRRRLLHSGAVCLLMLLLCAAASPARAARVRTTKKYHRVFVLGDSRTMYMRLQIGKDVKKTTFIYKNGGGYTWFRQYGYPRLVRALKKHRKGAVREGKPNAVVLNWGVNNLNMVNWYIPYYNSIAKRLKKLGCDLYIMSVNPYDPVRANMYGFLNIPSSASAAAAFNAKLRAGTKKNYAWIDSYSYLTRVGWTTGGGRPGGDGLHYTKQTSLVIYNYMIEEIDRAAG